MHAVPAHPVAAIAGGANRQPRQCFIGLAARDLEQVLPKLFFGVSARQHILRRIVHAAQVARVARVAAAPFARCGFQQQHAGARLARHQRCAQGGIAAAYYKYVDVPLVDVQIHSNPIHSIKKTLRTVRPRQTFRQPCAAMGASQLVMGQQRPGPFARCDQRPCAVGQHHPGGQCGG